jgi:hypothetical protein
MGCGTCLWCKNTKVYCINLPAAPPVISRSWRRRRMVQLKVLRIDFPKP